MRSLPFIALFLALALAALSAKAQGPDAPAMTDAGADSATIEAPTISTTDGGVDAASAAQQPDNLGPLTAEDGAPVGRAAPPTESARGRGPVRAGLEVFAHYSYRNFLGPGNNRTWFHAFDVPRVHGALEGEWEHARGRVVLEATRSASEGSLIGVAGDSLVVRVREAYGAYRFFDRVEVAAGVVPTLTVPELDGTWMLRAVAPSGVEANGLLSAADLGAKVRFDIPHDYGFVAVGAYNGEGYTSRELNRGKNLEGAVEIHPVPEGALKPLGVLASYATGSTGTALARADRFTGGLVWQGSRVRAGAIVTHGWGLAQIGTQRVLVASFFARVEPIPRLLVGARFDHAIRDTQNDPNDFLSTLWFAAGYRVALPFEPYLAITRSIPTTRAQAELPGTDAWELRVIARVIF